MNCSLLWKTQKNLPRTNNYSIETKITQIVIRIVKNQMKYAIPTKTNWEFFNDQHLLAQVLNLWKSFK